MKQITIISGKGGTGKTSITAALATLMDSVVIADCDVDTPNLECLLQPSIQETGELSGGSVALLHSDRCQQCQTCVSVCEFDAIKYSQGKVRIDPEYCEGCGVCAHFCPHNAIEMQGVTDGEWYLSETRLGPMVHAQLQPGADNSGKLVNLIRNKARTIAKEQKLKSILVDGSPGIGCPVISSISGASIVVIVTEPSLSGLHDLERIAALVERFEIPAVVCVNKCDFSCEMAFAIRLRSKEMGLNDLFCIPSDPTFREAQIMGKTVAEIPTCRSIGSIEKLKNHLLQALE